MDDRAGDLDDGAALEEVTPVEEGVVADVAGGGRVGAVAEDFFVCGQEQRAQFLEFQDWHFCPTSATDCCREFIADGGEEGRAGEDVEEKPEGCRDAVDQHADTVA